ncbi:MAG: hypothetical protein NC115_01445 [Bacteroidales bacterium]|nr:hypothetical protein [Bacteroidales bacterium]
MNNDFDSSVTDGHAGFTNTPMNHSNNISEVNLTDDMVQSAVTRACDFFGIPEAPVVNANGTCVWSNNPSTYEDDVLGFNRDQLLASGISGEDSLTLIYTHECAHRVLQDVYTDDWEEELACDFFAGVHAGMRGINMNNFEAATGNSGGSTSHPAGALRADFIEYGKQIVQEMQDRGIEVTFEGCMSRFNEHLSEKDELITEYRAQVLSDETEGMERHPRKGVKDYKVCATSHGCSGATDCDAAYGAYHR